MNKISQKIVNDITVTRKCNNRCKICCCEDFNDYYPLRKIFSELAKKKCEHIQILGGRAFCEKRYI